MNQRNYAAKCDGALFLNEQADGRRPDMRGRITLTKEVLKELVDIHKAGGVVTLNIAAWNKVSSRGTEFLSLQAEARDDSEYQKKGGQQRQAAPRRMPSRGTAERGARGQAQREEERQQPPTYAQDSAGNDLDDEIPF